MPDFLPAAETLAKGVKHIACYVADAISERRRAFDDDEGVRVLSAVPEASEVRKRPPRAHTRDGHEHRR
jgi:hypothetical protein